MSDGIFLNLAFELVYFVLFCCHPARGWGGADTVGEGHVCLNNCVCVGGIRGQSVEVAASFHLCVASRD